MAEEKFEVNLMRMIADELYFLAGMSAAREMYGKSYFSLGVAEKASIDQIVVATVGGNYRLITPEVLKSQTTLQAMGFLTQSEEPKKS